MEKPKPEVVEEDFKIPVLSVLKKGTILKNIFLNTPLRDQEPTKKSYQEEEEQEPILIGRHPDCHIVLDHPSISRFHLELRAKPRLKKLTVTDRSSVHGTWISGTKIPPNVPVDLVEGDLIKLGSSTRVYRLLWLSMNEAFEMENPLPPLLEEKEEAHQPINDEEEAWAMEEFPSAPPLPEFLEWELPSPAKEELVDGSLSFFSVPPQLSPAISGKGGASSSLFSILSQVIRELDLMKRRESLFRRSSKASSVLQWIEQCMEKESWWIHVQNSQETMPVAPTPPVTPTSQFGDGNVEFGPGTFNSMVSPTFGKLMEIVSPTAEDHILDCALLFRQLKNDGQLVVLSNNTTLKINAMAEGLLCEAPKEFRDSLVNPFSKRFMWVDSSPIGSTWSCSDQVGLMDNYYYNHNPTYGRGGAPKAAEAVKGLKLILLHNSHYGQTY